jgi:aryl-alcohol dehydrogenase-like predicted oxidoreductase
MSATSTHLRKLGKNGPEMPALGYGLISLAGLYGSPPDKEARFAVLDHAAKIGETFWDSSEFVEILFVAPEQKPADIC